MRSAHFIRTTLALAVALAAAGAHAQTPRSNCDMTGIGSAKLDAEGAPVTVLDVSTGKTGNVDYCLVKLQVPQAINIWVGLPLGGAWNGRWQSTGGGGYAGTVAAPTAALAAGYAAAATDTGHVAQVGGKFGMTEAGKPNVALQQDFAYRSEHLMAVLGKQLVQLFYGKQPDHAYWNGCSTGGRQGLRMAQDFPNDYDGILAGAPAIHWDRFQAAQIWPQVVQRVDNRGPIGGGDRMVLNAKLQLATRKAIEACDANDGVTDGVLADPRHCHYSAAKDTHLTTAACEASDASCLTPTEASSIDKIWHGPATCNTFNCSGPDLATRNLDAPGTKRLWYGLMRGTALNNLAGATPFTIAMDQARYWVYFNADWDWKTLNYVNYVDFFKDTVARVGPLMASDNPDLSAFRDHGGKLVLYHGWADPLIMPEGTIDYYDRVTQKLGGGYAKTQQFARLFMAPGVGHCAGGDGPQPQGLLESVVDWVEKGSAPATVLATRQRDGVTVSRPLCPYPAQAVWNGKGTSDDAANYACEVAK